MQELRHSKPSQQKQHLDLRSQRVFTRIAMHFVVTGRGLTDKAVARAVSLSADKYCSASIMLSRAGVEIVHSYEVVSPPAADALEETP